jgi:hypothetical protein
VDNFSGACTVRLSNIVRRSKNTWLSPFNRQPLWAFPPSEWPGLHKMPATVGSELGVSQLGV